LGYRTASFALFSRFRTVQACDGRTGRQTHDDSIYCASIASRGKKSSSAICIHHRINVH